MADMKDALRKAGLVSQKQVRQADHAGRVHRQDVGAEGLAAERERRQAELEADLEHKRAADQARERDLQAQREQEAQRTRVEALLRDGNLMAREGGPRRFYFTDPTGQIHFLDVSPGLARRLQMGDAAIVDAAGVLSADFVAISGKAAHELRLVDRRRVIFWNVRS
jgi:uncharacterized protein YaiL (DUF2058 family)